MVRVLLSILPFVKPYGDYNSSIDMVEALIDYYLGLSYRTASFKYKFSFMSLCRYWYSLSKVTSKFRFKLVAIDETGFKLVNRRMFIWYVVDLHFKRVIDVHLSLDSRTSIDVLRIVSRLGFNVEYVHDGGPWYQSLEWVKVKHKHVTFNVRNAVEQAFRSLKHRLKRFHNFKHRSSKRTTLNWIKAFTTILNTINLITRR